MVLPSALRKRAFTGGNIGHQTFGKDDNELILFDEHGHHPLPRASKTALAAMLISELAKRLPH
jgi:phosphopantothenoylcysteine decarboxylase/phosphopantothenate--cysteine ligase